MIGVQHDHDVGTLLERFEIAGLLIASVPAVLNVNDHGQPERARHLDRLVLAHVVDENNLGDLVPGNVGVGLFERLGRVVSGQDDDNAPSRLSIVRCLGDCVDDYFCSLVSSASFAFCSALAVFCNAL